MTENRTLTEEPREPDQKWPAVDPAQVFVIPSYSWMLSRVESVDSRIQTLTAFIATVTLAVPSAVRGASFASGWFIAAVIIAVGSVAVGVTARSSGALTLPDPLSYYNTSLHLAKWEFQRDALYFAGKAFAANRAVVERKAGAVSLMTISFLAELTCLLVWVVRS